MLNRERTHDEAENMLKSGCLRFRGRLRWLNVTHRDVDDFVRGAGSLSGTKYALRLRKVFFHVRAITSCPMDKWALHVMAPDIRAAAEQLEPMVRDHIVDGSDNAALAERRKHFAWREKRLAHFSHPTETLLHYPRFAGGLHDASPVLYLTVLHKLVQGLTTDYFMGLDMMAEEAGYPAWPEVRDAANRFLWEPYPLRPDEFSRLVRTSK